MKLSLLVIAVAALSCCTVSLTANAGTTTYKYDVQGRVIEIDYPNGTVVLYTYDNAGNRTKVVKTP